MTDLTLAEARAARDITNQEETIDRKIVAIEAQTASVMADMVTLHSTVADAPSKQLVIDKRDAFRASLASLTTV